MLLPVLQRHGLVLNLRLKETGTRFLRDLTGNETVEIQIIRNRFWFIPGRETIDQGRNSLLGYLLAEEFLPDLQRKKAWTL